jgi:hypothetical protein
MQASRVAHARARRCRFDPATGEARESAHGQLVADWVELLAPAVFDLRGPTAWPAEGSLLAHHLPFRIRAEDQAGVGIPGGRVAFDVFCAVGYRAGKPWVCIWRPSRAPNRTTGARSWPRSPVRPHGWSATPTQGNAAGDQGALARGRSSIGASGICSTRSSGCWPRRPESGPSEELAELRDRAEGALAGPSFWRPFVRAARALENDGFDRWIVVNGPTRGAVRLAAAPFLADRRRCP